MIAIRKSPWKGIKLLIVSSLFVAMGIRLLQGGPDSSRTMAAWASIIFFGLGIVVGILIIFDSRTHIRLSTEGVWDRSTKAGLIPWSKIKEAYPIDISGQGFVSLVLDEEFEATLRKSKLSNDLNNRVGAQTVNLHVGHTQTNAEDLAGVISKVIRASEDERADLLHTLHNTL